MKNDRLEIRIGEDLKERLMGAATRIDRKASDIVREAVTEKLEQIETNKIPFNNNQSLEPATV